VGYRVLTEQEVEQFCERGWVKLKEAFDPSDALAAQDYLWTKVEERGVLRNDPSTWTQPMVRINENYSEGPFQRCNSKRLGDAIEDLIGHGRWATRTVYGETETLGSFGWWPVNFSLDSDQPWTVPKNGWHWDGIHFRHRIDSSEQGLLCLCLFSDIAHQGGGTFIAEGSHKVVAKFLEKHSEGLELGPAIKMLNREHPWLAALTGTKLGGRPDEGGEGESDLYASQETAASAAAELSPETEAQARIDKFMNETYVDENEFRLRVLETTGGPGDVILCHPFLYHASSQNMIGIPRFMCNRTTPLTERLALQRDNAADYSPLEKSIRSALGYKTGV
jgi:hypothetical protein